MLSSLPLSVSICLLAILGSILGAAINYAIYAWAIYEHRPFSPWLRLNRDLLSEPVPDEAVELLNQRSGLDYLPIIGWLRLRRETELFGKWFWLRPLLIELTWLIGLPLFYNWQLGGGLTGGGTAFPGGVPGGEMLISAPTTFVAVAETWFWCHTVLIALMFIATFIDFDEKMIPDQITLPGTLLALTIAALVPWSRLPIVFGGRGGTAFESLDYACPPTGSAGPWMSDWQGLLTVLAIFSIWIWGLLPKIVPPREFRLGIFGSLKIMLASIVRRKRKNNCAARIKPRMMFGLTKLCVALWIIGIPILVIAWVQLPTINWLSLFSAMIGLAVAGGLIWAIRIVGGFVLGQDAMGFGDVTLMCMIGAFIGWHASITGFIYGIMFAIVFAIILLVVTGKNYLAFGPYLCMGALVSIFRWHTVWTAGDSFFRMGPWLLLVLAVSLIAMMILLPLVRGIKNLLLGPE